MTIKKDSEILVKVEEALADLLVVSYITENHKFQGVLLDSNKGNLPFGVYSLHPAFSINNSNSIKDEKLHSVSQRFTYQEPQYATERTQVMKKNASRGKIQPKQKMTVRLRPRKVLCSNCKGICNENNENVDSKKRKIETVEAECSSDAAQDAEKKFLMGSMLIPKLSRLNPTEISNAMKGVKKSERLESNKASDKIINKHSKSDQFCDNDRVTHEVAFVNVNEDLVVCDNLNSTAKQTQADASNFNSIFSSAKTIKFCFGEGEGTIVKIPPIVGDCNEDSGVCDMTKQSDMKAAKKALKKAKKQAKKGSIVKNTKTGMSPKHIGALSPRNTVAEVPSNLESIEKKHKHKVKHKKKHKIQKQRDENMSKHESDSINYFSDIKGIDQKLSISLRRLSSSSHEKRDDASGSEGWESDAVPDFPENSPESVGGRNIRVSQGDIVWGKVGGFPWWPGRVISVTAQSKAHIAWFGSTTSSLMPCDSLRPFLEDYKIRFNKKKRGAYKEAVKQATYVAKQQTHLEDPLASPTQITVSPRPINVFS